MRSRSIMHNEFQVESVSCKRCSARSVKLANRTANCVGLDVWEVSLINWFGVSVCAVKHIPVLKITQF